MLLAIVIAAAFTHYVAIPAWDYYRLPPGTRRILGKLRMPMTPTVKGGKPFEFQDILRQIEAASAGPKDKGIPIHVDPLGLQEADKSMISAIAVKADRRPIKEHLEQVLPTLGLDYYIKDGLLTITSANSARLKIQSQPKDAIHPE